MASVDDAEAVRAVRRREGGTLPTRAAFDVQLDLALPALRLRPTRGGVGVTVSLRRRSRGAHYTAPFILDTLADLLPVAATNDFQEPSTWRSGTRPSVDRSNVTIASTCDCKVSQHASGGAVALPRLPDLKPLEVE